ncbi:hypothetical protein KC19_2G024200 [Ceratodon purpureus]|uniref:Peptidase A1 domain-containing protein n=1 Tax=Ceratodon purpureus TaxID=3225 RepID=A0A8T0IRE7_CERPU|nr:hypothetical protein KC19_2G024200 [Ceratodon purpureus]
MEGNMEIIALLVILMTLTLTIEAQQFSLVHKYAHLEGSPANTQGQGVSPEYSALLKAHDRRRLDAFFPLGGSADLPIGLYYTEITLGTPPQNYHVDVDTGSDVLWLNCAPCSNCPLTTTIPGITLRHYDPTLSSTDTALGCTDANCAVASYGNPGQCTVSPPGACAYSIGYGDGSTTEGYIINDIITFHDSATTTAGANIYFGCGTKQTGNLLESTSAVDGLIGFGKAAISVPTQLANQGLVSHVFAHCLQGDTVGGGNIVIGNITEPGITYTPMVPGTHYNVALQNIGVNGVNVTDPTSFEITASNEGVIMDSGATLAYLIEPAYDQFVAAIESGAPVPSERISDGNGGYDLCWSYSGDIATTFPSVQLFFDGGAVMNLAPTNYLYLQAPTSGASAYCMGWKASTGTVSAPGYTLFGDIVLKDQLVVYDNTNQILGWKPFNCSQPIPGV